jgi:enoyl-CoA hydratase
MTVEVVREGAVWTVWLARPERRNAVDRATAEALFEAFGAFEADAEARVAVLAGRGETFCAGADLKALAAADAGPGRAGLPEGANEVVDPGSGPILGTRGPMGPTRMALGKPVIAALSGHAVAGGLELALWCDLRVMEDDAVLGVFCRRWGVPLIDGGTARLPHVVGLSRALDLILTGREVHAEEALRIGLVDRVVPRGEAVAAAQALAASIAGHPWACVVGDRAALYEGLGQPLEAALKAELAHGKATLASGESVAGAQAFTAGAGRHGAARGVSGGPDACDAHKASQGEAAGERKSTEAR